MTRFLTPGPRREEPYLPPTPTASARHEEMSYRLALAATRRRNPEATEPTAFDRVVALQGGLREFTVPAEPGRVVTAGVLKASAADRIANYLLLPWGQVGRTSIGPVIVAGPGVVELPDDPATITLNVEHDHRRPVGRCIALEEAESGLLATFEILRNTAGDDLLIEIAEGVRTGVSVELEGVRRNGQRLLAGRLTGAGAVVRPAFDSARIREGV